MLRICLFEEFEVYVDGQPVPGLGPQLRRLLAMLTLRANRPVEKGRLLKELWPESETHDIVRTSTGRLVRALGTESERLQTDRETVTLDLNGAEVDIVKFAALVDQNTQESLGQAVKLHRGKLLANWEEPWIEEPREDLNISYLDALKSLAAQALSVENYLRAEYLLQRFVNGRPDMEWGWDTLFATFQRSGNRAKVLETYPAYIEYLRRRSLAVREEVKPSERVIEIVKHVAREEQRRTLDEIKATAAQAAAAQSQSAAPQETSGGAVPMVSQYYIQRAEDSLVYAALGATGSTILIKGPRQIGKSSLLARALHHVRSQGAHVLLTDWQNIAQADLESAQSFFLCLAHTMADQLGLDVDLENTFGAKRSPASNFERFFRKQVFPAISGRLVWGIDEADRLFTAPYCDDVFSKIRAWHNERSLDPAGPWNRLSFMLAYSTEASLFIKNPNQSPFNVGTHVAMRDFTFEQVGELNARYGDPLDPNDLLRVYSLVGGHPYLVRRCFDALTQRTIALADLEAESDLAEGVFGDHLERMKFALLLNPALTEAVRQFLRADGVPAREDFVRLCAAGIMTGSSPSKMQPRCPLYDRFLRTNLL